jgi:signal transduction histidine kinase
MSISTEQKIDNSNHNNQILSKNYNSSLVNRVGDTYKLSERILKWSILETEGMYDSASAFRLDDVMADVISMISRVATPKRIQVFLEPNHGAVVFADQDMFFSMAHYLVSNSVKFANSGEKVRISSRINQSMVIVTIANSGSSLSAQNLHRLFEVDADSSSLGTVGDMVAGVEILLCHRFAEKNKGELFVTSGDRQGITFSFTLPKVAEVS